MKAGKLVAAIVFGVFIAAGAAAQSDLAVIRELTGKVEVMAPGGAWQAAQVGMKVDNAASISTGFKSTAVVALGESVLTIKPLTRLTLEEIVRREGGESVSLYLLAGRVRADVKPPAGSKTEFKVKSATATASVRGTGFDFDSVNLEVFEGVVGFEGAGGGPTMPVAQGESSSVDENGGAAPPVSVMAAAAAIPPLPVGLDQSLITNLLTPPAPVVDRIGTVAVTVSW